jgi:DNA-directed RNA polymerase specialized sigma24 family protein
VRSRVAELWPRAVRLAGDEGAAASILEVAFAECWREPDPARSAEMLVLRRALAAGAGRRRGLEVDVDALLPRFRADGSHAHEPRPWSARPLARRTVRSLVDRLPHPFRGALLLCDGERLPRELAARVLGLAEPDVDGVLHRGRLALRALLERRLCVSAPPAPRTP